jgi:hypothetical protein
MQVITVVFETTQMHKGSPVEYTKILSQGIFSPDRLTKTKNKHCSAAQEISHVSRVNIYVHDGHNLPTKAIPVETMPASMAFEKTILN